MDTPPHSLSEAHRPCAPNAEPREHAPPRHLTMAFFALMAVAFWPVGVWYILRSAPLTDRVCGWFALLTALAFLFRRLSSRSTCPPPLLLCGGLILVYAATFCLAPQPVSVLVAMLTISVALSKWRFGLLLHPAMTALLFLALPVAARLNFYIGYPLRVAVGSITVPLLQLAGVDVVRQGAVLDWRGQLIAIDAPCAGIKMLWAGAYLVSTLCCLYDVRPSRTVVAGLLTLFAIVLGNALRASTLFWVEHRLVDGPEWLHEAVGTVTFALTAVLIVGCVRLVGGRQSCVE